MHVYVLPQFFDKDDSGYITVDELQGALKEHGDAAVVAAHINEILADVDKDKVGVAVYQPCVRLSWQRHSMCAPCPKADLRLDRLLTVPGVVETLQSV